MSRVAQLAGQLAKTGQKEVLEWIGTGYKNIKNVLGCRQSAGARFKSRFKFSEFCLEWKFWSCYGARRFTLHTRGDISHSLFSLDRMARAMQNVLLEQEFAYEQYNRHQAVYLRNQHYPLRIVRRQTYNILCYRALIL